MRVDHCHYMDCTQAEVHYRHLPVVDVSANCLHPDQAEQPPTDHSVIRASEINILTEESNRPSLPPPVPAAPPICAWPPPPDGSHAITSRLIISSARYGHRAAFSTKAAQKQASMALKLSSHRRSTEGLTPDFVDVPATAQVKATAEDDLLRSDCDWKRSIASQALDISCFDEEDIVPVPCATSEEGSRPRTSDAHATQRSQPHATRRHSEQRRCPVEDAHRSKEHAPQFFIFPGCTGSDGVAIQPPNVHITPPDTEPICNAVAHQDAAYGARLVLPPFVYGDGTVVSQTIANAGLRAVLVWDAAECREYCGFAALHGGKWRPAAWMCSQGKSARMRWHVQVDARVGHSERGRTRARTPPPRWERIALRHMPPVPKFLAKKPLAPAEHGVHHHFHYYL